MTNRDSSRRMRQARANQQEEACHELNDLVAHNAHMAEQVDLLQAKLREGIHSQMAHQQGISDMHAVCSSPLLQPHLDLPLTMVSCFGS